MMIRLAVPRKALAIRRAYVRTSDQVERERLQGKLEELNKAMESDRVQQAAFVIGVYCQDYPMLVLTGAGFAIWKGLNLMYWLLEKLHHST